MKNSKLSKNDFLEVNSLMNDIKTLESQKSAIEEKIEEKKIKLYSLVGLNDMSESEKITTDRWVVSFIVKNDYLKFDSKRFQKEQPTLFEKYKTQKASGCRYLDYSKCKEI